MLASLMAFGAAPAGAAIDTSASCPDSIADAGFTDLAGVPAAAVDAINCVADYGISTGTTATTFDPFAEVARWQMALFITRQVEAHGLGSALPAGTDQGFTDLGGVPAAAVTSINQIAELGISTGTSATTFDPFASVERWQMALFLQRLITIAVTDNSPAVTLPDGSDQGFTDLAGVPTAGVTAINVIAQLDVADGTTATTFDPFAAVERWAMALFLARTLAADGITPTPPTTTSATGAPELLSVDVGNTFGGETQLSFNFDEDVSVVDESLFYLALPDGTLVSANDASTTVADESKVNVLFEDDDVDFATAASVDYDAVVDEDDVSNIPSGVGIQSVSLDQLEWPDGAGGTSNFPEVVGIDGFDDDDDAVDFEFDEDVDDSCVGSDYYLFEESGAVWRATACSDVDADETITAEGFENIVPAFGEPGHDSDFSQADFDDIVRVFVGLAAAGGDSVLNPPHAFDVSGNGATTAPYLQSVTVTDGPDGEWDFEFSDTLVDFDDGDGADGAFHLVTVDGTLYTSDTASRDGDDTDVVNVEFPDNTVDPDLVMYAVYFDPTLGSLTVVEDASQPALWDSVMFDLSFSSGETAGPELISSDGNEVGFNNDAFLLNLGFDEDLLDDDALGAQPWATDFWGFKANGSEVFLDADDIDDLDGSLIDLLFDSGEDDTDDFVDGELPVVGLSFDSGTLPEDEYGNTSYPDSIGCSCD
jgi:hypothetical protein